MTDDRAVSTTVNYVLGLSIAFALVTGLFMAGGDFVQNQREDSIRVELEVLGEQVAADLMMADRLAETTTDNETVRVRRTLPPRVGGSSYSVSVEGGEDPYVVMQSSQPEITVEAEFTNETNVEMTEVNSRHLIVNYTAESTLAIEGRENP